MVPPFFQLKAKAFTLIELLTVIAIISILTALVLPNYRAGEKSFALQRSAQKIAQDIRRAEEMAMSAKEIVGPSGEKFVPSGGYGIFFQILPHPPYYEIILFADCNNNQYYNSGNVCGTPPNKFSEKIENLNLESGVKINSLSPSSPLNITFKPPDPTTNINPSDSLATITLTNNGQTKVVKVNKAGLIYVE